MVIIVIAVTCQCVYSSTRHFFINILVEIYLFINIKNGRLIVCFISRFWINIWTLSPRSMCRDGHFSGMMRERGRAPHRTHSEDKQRKERRAGGTRFCGTLVAVFFFFDTKCRIPCRREMCGVCNFNVICVWGHSHWNLLHHRRVRCCAVWWWYIILVVGKGEYICTKYHVYI